MVIPDVDSSRLEEVVHGGGALLVDFWGPMCSPCRVLKPHLQRLADEHDGVRFVAVNAETETAATERFGVTGVPTLILFREGAEISRLTGPVLPSKVAELLQTHCS